MLPWGFDSAYRMSSHTRWTKDVCNAQIFSDRRSNNFRNQIDNYYPLFISAGGTQYDVLIVNTQPLIGYRMPWKSALNKASNRRERYCLPRSINWYWVFDWAIQNSIFSVMLFFASMMVSFLFSLSQIMCICFVSSCSIILYFVLHINNENLMKNLIYWSAITSAHFSNHLFIGNHFVSKRPAFDYLTSK